MQSRVINCPKFKLVAEIESANQQHVTQPSSSHRTRHRHAKHILILNHLPQRPSSPNMRHACRFEVIFGFMLYSIMPFGVAGSGCVLSYIDSSPLLSAFRPLSLGSELITLDFPSLPPGSFMWYSTCILSFILPSHASYHTTGGRIVFGSHG